MRTLLLVVLAAHFAVAALRIAPKHWGRRLAQIERYEEQGRCRFHFGEAQAATAAVLEWLAANTPEDSVVLWRGEWRGVMEFAPALLWPRLVYAASAAPPGAERVHGRPIARGAYPGLGEGQLVLVASRDALRLERR